MVFHGQTNTHTHTHTTKYIDLLENIESLRIIEAFIHDQFASIITIQIEKHL